MVDDKNNGNGGLVCSLNPNLFPKAPDYYEVRFKRSRACDNDAVRSARFFSVPAGVRLVFMVIQNVNVTSL